jgi:hypothetical protein
VNAAQAASQIVKIPWLPVIGTLVAFLAVFITITWWTVGEIKSLRKMFSGLITGEITTIDGEKIKVINGFQDDKLKETHELAKNGYNLARSNSDRLSAVEKEQKEQRKMMKKIVENQDRHQGTTNALLGETSELLAATKRDRLTNSEYIEETKISIDLIKKALGIEEVRNAKKNS